MPTNIAIWEKLGFTGPMGNLYMPIEIKNAVITKQYFAIFISLHLNLLSDRLLQFLFTLIRLAGLLIYSNNHLENESSVRLY